ncbi:MAG: AAA family ATPase [Eubacteriales bacterium]
MININKPYLIIITGRPGAGKTTLAQKLSDEICMPVISRDKIKEGYVNTFGKRHTQLPEDANKIATDIFFNTIISLLTDNVSVIAEAAFQHRVWGTMIDRFMEKSRVCVIICRVDEKVALDRFIQRGLDDPQREYFHGDKGVDMARKGIRVEISPYEEPSLDAPTFYVDTSDGYVPSVKELGKIIIDKTPL